MKAAVITRQGTPVADHVSVVDDWPDPVPGPGHLVVRTLCSALSAGTELHFYRGDLREGVALDESLESLGGSFRYPTVLDDNGARHVVFDENPLFLGARVDSDVDGVPTLASDGDDLEDIGVAVDVELQTDRDDADVTELFAPGGDVVLTVES